MREITFEQIDSVLKIEEACFHKEAWSKMDFESMRDWANLKLFGTFEEEQLIGYIGIFDFDEHYEIATFGIMPEYQNQGRGEELLNEAFDWMKENHPGMVTLEVRVSNAHAIHLYQKMGFDFLAIRKNYYMNPREDGYLMGRESE